jgi:glycosyltransferase involved in cell wall biosynthesis
LESIALRRTGGVICNSDYTVSQVAALAQRTWKVPNALVSDFFQPKITSKSPIPVFLNIGHIAPYKGQVDLLRAARALHQAGLKFELEFIGGVDRESHYGRQFVDAINVAQSEGWARHAGILPRPEVIRRLDGACALIHVSREESFGLAVAEALARDLKLFAFKAGGVVDVLAGVEGAESFQPGQWRELIDSIAAWLCAGTPKPPPASQLMHDRFSPASIARRHLQVYRELLAG